MWESLATLRKYLWRYWRGMSRGMACLILKDLGLIHDEARNGGVPLLLGALAEQRFSEARARGMGDEDMAALVKLWEEPASVQVAPSH